MVPYDETIPGTDVTFRMIPVPGGTFRMGSPADEEGRTAAEGPTFTVRVEPFWMGRCEVTWAEYRRYMAACDLFKALEAASLRPVTAANEADAVTAPSNLYDPTTTFTHGDDPALPAATMTQFAARQYTKWLSGLTGRFYRLPAEAEWEHACRAGSDLPWHAADSADVLADFAWFAANADDTTHTVGSRKPNAWGLHDMHGNVAEWVVDELAAGGYARQAALDQPVAATDTVEWPQKLYPRVLRGGAYYDEAAECRSAARRGSRDAGGTPQDPDWKDVDPNLPKSPWWYTEEPALGVGMRVVRPLAEPPVAVRRRWWDADTDGIRADSADRILQGRGARGIVDPDLPAAAKAAGLGE
ncbi:MAG: formylglycine-generating enzyme family protein [Planctomycetia bacterium]|nr:formylglycine-generating enzyme family protein [Planctomycetia bacterium]